MIDSTQFCATVSPCHRRNVQRLSFRRSAVTLMEVVFAIGVILGGLVGIAALIPIAANNAQATLELDQSISESTSAAAIGVAQSFNDLDTLVLFDKPAGGSGPRGAPYAYVPSNGMRTVDWKIRTQTVNNPLTGMPIDIHKLETPGYGHMPLGSGLSSGICIDPLGMPDPIYANAFNAVTDSDSAYDYSRFPYYGERYRVLSEPNLALNNDGGLPAPSGTTPNWPMSPRMWRVTLRNRSVANTTGIVSHHQLMSSAAIRDTFYGSVGSSLVPSKDSDAPQSILTSKTSIGGFSVDAAKDKSSQYSWFATLVPSALGGSTFRQSIVVVRRRLPPVPNRVGDPTALDQQTRIVDESDDNPNGERVTWIGDAIGFQGGTGGEVQIYGSLAVSDEINAGEWVLLSRQRHQIVTGTLLPTGPAVHRWFRVLRVGASEKLTNYAWAGGTHDVWRRWVTLAGPDWAFQDEPAGTNTTPIDDTFCTIVSGAVSVVESEVLIP